MSRDTLSILVVLFVAALAGGGAFLGRHALPVGATIAMVIVALLLALLGLFLIGLNIVFGPKGFGGG